MTCCSTILHGNMSHASGEEHAGHTAAGPMGGQCLPDQHVQQAKDTPAVPGTQRPPRTTNTLSCNSLGGSPRLPTHEVGSCCFGPWSHCLCAQQHTVLKQRTAAPTTVRSEAKHEHHCCA